MLNVVTSAIVNTPPYVPFPSMLLDHTHKSRPNGVITMVSSLASNNHRTMHHSETDETMVGHLLLLKWPKSLIRRRFPSSRRKPMVNRGNKSSSWAAATGVKSPGRMMNGSSKSASRRKKEWARRSAILSGRPRRDGPLLECSFNLFIPASRNHHRRCVHYYIIFQ